MIVDILRGNNKVPSGCQLSAKTTNKSASRPGLPARSRFFIRSEPGGGGGGIEKQRRRPPWLRTWLRYGTRTQRTTAAHSGLCSSVIPLKFRPSLSGLPTPPTTKPAQPTKSMSKNSVPSPVCNVRSSFRSVTRAHIIAWRKHVESRNLTVATIRRKLSALSALVRRSIWLASFCARWCNPIRATRGQTLGHRKPCQRRASPVASRAALGAADSGVNRVLTNSPLRFLRDGREMGPSVHFN
jgi:hypothetical protein